MPRGLNRLQKNSRCEIGENHRSHRKATARSGDGQLSPAEPALSLERSQTLKPVPLSSEIFSRDLLIRSMSKSHAQTHAEGKR